MTNQIPLVDLAAEHAAVALEVRAGFDAVMARSAYILGDEVAAFEAEFAAFSGAAHAVGVANGGDALELMLRAAGIGAGDEVLVPANTFIATVQAVVRAGATPVLVDCDPVHFHMDPNRASTVIGRHTKGLLPVHLYGQMAPMEELGVLARAAGADLLEDAAQAHGALRNGKPPGAMGLAAAFSFYPSKNLGAYGDAGGIVTGSASLAARLRRLRNYGSDAKYVHPEVGFNSRLDTLQAVVLSAKLKRLALWNAARRAAAARYDEMLAGMPDVVRPTVREGNVHVWHLYVVRVPRRDMVLDRLKADGIGAGIHYPIPIHLQGAFGYLGHAEGDFPQAERAAREVLSLPMYPSLTAPQQERVAASLARALAS